LEALVVCFGFGYLDKHLVILVKRDELLEVWMHKWLVMQEIWTERENIFPPRQLKYPTLYLDIKGQHVAHCRSITTSTTGSPSWNRNKKWGSMVEGERGRIERLSVKHLKFEFLR
jgi:hypothetical protein